MIAAAFEILTVGLPFCVFKFIAGVALSQDWLTAWGIADTLINSLNLASLLIAHRRLTEVCLLSLLLCLMRRPAAGQRARWQNLGTAGDMFFSFALVAFMLGGGFLPALPPLHLQSWHLAVILNVLGAGSLRLSQTLRDFSPPATAASEPGNVRVQMHIRSADPMRDAEVVAGLIYDTDPYLFPFLFGRRQRALPLLRRLFQLEENSFSHRYVQIAEVGGEVAGILIGYAPHELTKENEAADFRRVFGFWQSWQLQPRFWLLRRFLDKSEITGHYIQNVCVAAAHRGKGVGSGLIRHFCRVSPGAVWLDVEMGNKENRAIYEHLGFRVVRKISLFVPGLGSIRMVRQ